MGVPVVARAAVRGGEALGRWGRLKTAYDPSRFPSANRILEWFCLRIGLVPLERAPSEMIDETDCSREPDCPAPDPSERSDCQAADVGQSPIQREVVLFTSPKAGSGAAREQIPRLLQLLAQEGIPHRQLGSAEELCRIVEQCRETGRAHPIVVAAGGDGTISLVASVTSKDTPLLPMPMGTENLIARFLGQGNAAEAIMNTLRSGREIRVDAGSANGRLFLIMATVGFDAEVVRRLHLRRKGHIRRHSYLKPIMQTMIRYRFPRLTISTLGLQQEILDHRTAGWAMVFNLPCYAAGLKIVPSANGQDGKLDVISFAGSGLCSGVRYVVGVMLRIHRRFRDVEQRQVSRIRIEAERPVAYELDGDYVGRTPVEIRVLPQRVRLLAPPD